MPRNRGKQQNEKDQRSCQENWGYQGKILCEDGHNKELNDKDLTEAKEIKKRWRKYTELLKKNLNDPDNYDGVVTHLEPDKCVRSSGPQEALL